MARLHKGKHVGLIRRKLLVNAAKSLGFEGDPEKVSNVELVRFVIERKPEMQLRQVNAKRDVDSILEWFEKHDRQAIKSPKRERKPSAPSRQGSPSTASKETFYASWEWRTLRMEVLKRFGRRCMCCGSMPGDRTVGGAAVRLVVDHIKPLHGHWHLRLDPNNLQVLCDECNQGKGAWDETDHRSESERLIAEQLRYSV